MKHQLIERTVVAVHRGLGIDPNDPQTTYGLTRFSVRQTSNGEDTAGNPLHFALLVGVAVVVVASFAIAVLATIYPSRSAAALTPVEAIRHE